MEHEANETSDSPHFGDEDTLREAQPVVPLAEIRGNKIRNTLLLTSALLISLGLGAGVAIFLDHLRQPKSVQASSTTEPANASNVEDPTLAAVSEEEEMMDLPSEELVADVPVVDDQDLTKKTRQKRVAGTRNSARIRNSDNAPGGRNSDVARIRNSDNRTQTATSQKPENANANDSVREPILVDQWEEKRSRRVNSSHRVTPNQRAKANARPDLFRIREIFEGARPR